MAVVSTAGGITPATPLYILQKCCKSHEQRMFRHDYVVQYLVGRLRQLGLEALLEPYIVYAQSFRKPDIVAWSVDQSYIIRCGGRTGRRTSRFSLRCQSCMV